MNDIILYDYDKDLIKENLDIENMIDLLSELKAEPEKQNDNILICLTVCHGGDSHKLYYYDNTKLFHCFTGCEDPTYDIFELVRKVKTRETGFDWDLPKAVDFVARFFGYAPNARTDESEIANLEDWKILNSYDRIKDINPVSSEVELKIYDGNFLKNLPTPIITPWIKDGISKISMDKFGIRYDPKNCGAVIPHYDINENLIGIRERCFIKEDAEKYGKYRPATFCGKMYNHPLGYNLYGLNKTKENIKKFKKAIVMEGEKSVLKYDTWFPDSNITVACCGSSLIAYQVWLLSKLEVEEIIVGFDKQYQELNDKEHIKLVKNLKNIHKKYGNNIKISFLFDKENLLGYKESPVDRDKDTFLELFKRRIDIYES